MYRLYLDFRGGRIVDRVQRMTCELLVPRSLTELRQMAGSGRLIAGGTDLLVQMRAGRREERLIDLTNLIDRPQPVEANDGMVEISALAPIATVVRDLQGRLPALAAAARLFGSVQIRNRATLGGNLANASPAGDMFPPLIVAGAEAIIDGPTGSRVIPVSGLATGPGRSVLTADEWIAKLRVPLPTGEEGFIKLGGRAALAISIVSLAWRWNRQRDGTLTNVQLALGRSRAHRYSVGAGRSRPRRPPTHRGGRRRGRRRHAGLDRPHRRRPGQCLVPPASSRRPSPSSPRHLRESVPVSIAEPSDGRNLMDVGLSVWLDRPARDCAAVAVAAEAAGFSTLWVPDHYFLRDSFVALALAAVQTTPHPAGDGRRQPPAPPSGPVGQFLRHASGTLRGKGGGRDRNRWIRVPLSA